MTHEFPSLMTTIILRAIVNAPENEREERIELALSCGTITEEQARELRQAKAA